MCYAWLHTLEVHRSGFLAGPLRALLDYTSAEQSTPKVQKRRKNCEDMREKRKVEHGNDNDAREGRDPHGLGGGAVFYFVRAHIRYR